MRRLVIAVVTALVVVGVPVAAYATIDHCPAGVSDVRGTQPSYATIDAYLVQSAAAHSVPVQVLRAVAYQESRWIQFESDGKVRVSGDTVCGLGIMQITSDARSDAVQLASDWQYNVDVGAAFLHDKWVESHTQSPSNPHPAPNNYSADDPHALENWYYVFCLYNGCSGSDTYASAVADIVGDPFRYADTVLKPYLPYGGFTKPADADSSYVFPHAFQADLSPQQFVFYDSSTGDVTNVVAAPTHDDRAAHPSYGAGTYGPDGPAVSCTFGSGCIWWRLFETRGVIGRAHWTHSVTGSESVRVTWAPPLPRSGMYRVTTYVPDVTKAAETMGNATYHLAGMSVTVDQAATKGTWVSLGDRSLSPTSTVYVNDVSDVAGHRIVADGMRFAALTSLSLAQPTATLTYGQSAPLTVRLTQQGTTVGLAGKPVSLYRRVAGTATWHGVGTWNTDATGYVTVNQTPVANTEYQFRHAATATDTVASVSNTRRINVRTRVSASLSRTTVPRNVGVTVSTSVAPSHAGQSVTLMRYYGGVWHGFAARTLNTSSAASFAFAMPAPGTYYFRVYKAADADHVASWSATLTLKVT